MKVFDKWVYLIFLLCGIITALPFIFDFLWLLSWISFSPVIYYFLQRGSALRLRRAFWLGFTFGMGYFGVMYHWFAYLYPMEFLGVEKLESIALIAVCWLGLAAIQAFEFGIVPALYRMIRPSESRPWLCTLLFVSLWSVFEWQQTLAWRGVPWGRLALSQSGVLPLLQSASLFGSMFVGGIIIAVNGLIASAKYTYDIKKYAQNGTDLSTESADSDTASRTKTQFHLKEAAYKLKAALATLPHIFKTEWRAVAIYFTVAVTLFCSNAVFGAIRMALHDETDGKETVAAVIQGNVSSTEKWTATSSEIAESHIYLTEQCVEQYGATLVVWAETAIPTDLNIREDIKNDIAETADRLNITLIVGAFSSEFDNGDGRWLDYNSLYLFDADGNESPVKYHKRKLVPFGESLPMEWFIRTFLPILLDMNILAEPLEPGTDSEIYDTAHGKLGGLICFDSIYNALTLDSVRDGAELFILSTNDSWYSDSAAVRQHNNHAVLRAIETSRYVVRSANTGISSIIDSEGRVLKSIPALRQGFTSATVYATGERTLYSYVGDIYSYISVAFTLCAFAYSAARKIKTHIQKNKKELI